MVSVIFTPPLVGRLKSRRVLFLVDYQSQLFGFAFAAELAHVGLDFQLQIIVGGPLGAVLGKVPGVAVVSLSVNRFRFFSKVDPMQIRLPGAPRSGSDLELREAMRAVGYERGGKNPVQFKVAQREFLAAYVATNSDRPFCPRGHSSLF
jgi:hypothetical protein